MTLHLLFITVSITFSKNHRSLNDELDAKRKRELIENMEYKKSLHSHY
ncbi:hypothetical protein [Guptibacillus algicola]|nr:hypothetical protein [Alkalihalobacillus algicola]MCA0986140.1 hypothetical protein [Alkalihalobacillus algicola]